MKTTERGRTAEALVAEELGRRGFKIIARNWRTRVCELDIVAQKAGVIYFVEVKYRSGISQGSGFEYAGPKKIHRLEFAAQVYCQQQNWEGDYQIVVAEISGQGFESIKFAEIG